MPMDESWAALLKGMERAGDRIGEIVAGLDPAEQADGHRAILRALNNQLGRFEVDRERPELVPFNGWREKFFMDNPDFRYWVADVRDDRSYRITGTVGDAVYQSITAYAGNAMAARAVGRIDSDTLPVDEHGRFEVTASSEPPSSGAWLPIEAGVRMIWVRHFHADVARDALGDCRIEPIDPPAAPPRLEAGDLDRQIRRLGDALTVVPEAIAASIAAEVDRPNQLRHWSEMAGGAAFTEPGIHYVRGSWNLGPDEALLIEGPVVESRYWNILLYSRFLNSLDYRNRQVSRTSGTATIRDGRFRFAIANRDPGGSVDWLDNEGRTFGLVVMRWLHPAADVPLPTVSVRRIDELGA